MRVPSQKSASGFEFARCANKQIEILETYIFVRCSVAKTVRTSSKNLIVFEYNAELLQSSMVREQKKTFTSKK